MTGQRSRRLPAVSRPAVFAETKFLPARPSASAVSRAALVRRLIESDALPLTVVVGAAGSGKSWLLGEWFHAVDAGPDAGRITWLTADRGDADPVRFWRGFVTAVQRIEPSFGVAASDTITLDRAMSADALEEILVDDAQLTCRLRIIIDDAHLIGTDALQQLRHLLERGLRNLRVVLASRTEPDIGIQRLRLRGDVLEVREAQLSLDRDETGHLLRALGLDPTSVDLDDLLRRTEGWVAGVQMAAISAAGADDPAARMSEVLTGGRMIADYLVSEVLASLSPEVRRFLEDTCVVDELDAVLCRDLTRGGAGAEVTLQQVEDANLLITRLDAEGSVYRYHHLLAETLRTRLRIGEPERFRAQHLRAADHLVGRDSITAAIRHYWFAGRHDEANRLISDNAVSVIINAETPPPVAELELGLSREELAASPGDALGYALALIVNARPTEAAALLDLLDQTMGDELEPTDRLHMVCARGGTALLLGDTAAAARSGAEVAAVLGEGKIAPDLWTTAALPQCIRAAAWEGQFEWAEELVRTADRYRLGVVGPSFDRVEMAGAMAFIRYEEGDLAGAHQLAQDAVAAAAELDVVGSGAATAAHAVLAVTLLDLGDLDLVAASIDETLRWGRAERIPSFVLAAMASARLLRADGHFDAALAALEGARSQLRRIGSSMTLSDRLDQVEIGIRIPMGDVAEASQLADRLQPGRAGHLMRALVDLAAGRVSVAGSIASALAASASTPRQRLEVALLRARLALERQDPDIDTVIEEVLDLVEATGAVHLVAEAGTGVLQAAVKASRSRPRSAAVGRLTITRPLQRPAEQARPEYRVEELSARELIVLQYMATSLSNQEIARELYLSVNTVKTHIKHVLRKLRASSRIEAVQRAQALHYL